jgi:hypothetical protein
MWRSRNNRDGTTVVCIACGTSLPRSEAREYDKEGNRWERHGKSFEHLCKECYRGLCHQPRDELESLLVDVERTVDADGNTDSAPEADGDPSVEVDSGSEPATDTDPESNLPVDPDTATGRDQHADPDDRTFLAEYFRVVEERYGPAEEPGHES